MNETGALAQISQARRYLEQAKDLTDIKAVKDMAEAARLYARAKHLGFETENAAAEIKVRADRKLGEVLAVNTMNKGGRPPKTAAPDATVSAEPTLAELGITDHESSNAQAVAALPDAVFEETISATKAAGKPLATKPLVREGRKRKRQQAEAAMARSRSAPRTPAEQASPITAQTIYDAQLRAAFSRAISGVSTINVLAPSRVAEVLAVADADRAEDAIERLGVWLEQFRAVRASGALRLMGGTRG